MCPANTAVSCARLVTVHVQAAVLHASLAWLYWRHRVLRQSRFKTKHTDKTKKAMGGRWRKRGTQKKARRAAKPGTRKRKRARGYAGTQRAIVSDFLRGKRWTSHTRKTIFGEAAAHAARVTAEGGEELARFQRRGFCGKISQSVGGSAFGRAVAAPHREGAPLQLALRQGGDIDQQIQECRRAHRRERDSARQIKAQQSEEILSWVDSNRCDLPIDSFPRGDLPTASM